MNLQTIEMPRHEARAAFLDYRRAVRERHSKEDESLMRGYRALARGQQIINLREVIQAGGVGDEGLPKLAVLPAHHRWCHVARLGNGSVMFAPSADARWRRVAGSVRLPARDRLLLALGWIVFHFSGSEFNRDPQRCIREIDAAASVRVNGILDARKSET